MPALVSILIPCYNAAPWLKRTIESALHQSWLAKEIIVVDDGSRDNSVEIAQSFSKAGVRVICQPNGGASRARNTALEASHGDWLQFLDADDLLGIDKIALQMTLADQIGDQFVLCSKWSRFTHSIEEAGFPDEPLCRDSDPIDWLITKLAEGAMMHPAAWLVSRSVATHAGPWNESLSLDDDGEYFTRVVLASRGVRFCGEAKAYYRSNLPDSLSARHSEAAWRSAYKSQLLCAQHLLAAANTAATRQACADLFQRLAYSVYADAPQLARECLAEAERFGGSRRRPPGGPVFQAFAAIAGWKMATKIRRWRANQPG